MGYSWRELIDTIPRNLFRLNFVHAGAPGFVYLFALIVIRPTVFQLLYHISVESLPLHARRRPRKLWLLESSIRFRGSTTGVVEKCKLAPVPFPPEPQ